MPQNASIREIAQAANVSTATVSRVFNHPESVAPTTRARVEAVIRQAKYSPNLVARGLRTNKMPIIGIIAPDIANEFFANIVVEIQVQLFARDYWAIICNSNVSQQMQAAYLDMLMQQNISGLIFIARDSATRFDIRDIPVVYVDRYPERESDADAARVIVESDNYRGGYLAAQELIRAGCSDLWVMNSKYPIRAFQNRTQGFFQALRDHGRGADEGRVLLADAPAVKEGYECMLAALARGIRFDGIFAQADYLAIGTINALRERGVRVPEDVKIVGFDDISLSKYNHPSITTIHQYPEKLAEAAVNALMALLDGGSAGGESPELAPVKLIQRESTRRNQADAL